MNWIESKDGGPPSHTSVIAWLEEVKGRRWEDHWYRCVVATTGVTGDGTTTWHDVATDIEIPGDVVRRWRWPQHDER